MVVLRGNLGQRQKQLNTIVNEAASRYDRFEDIKDMRETSDIEKFMKIDLASKHKNIDYIMEVIKAGDTLHITRALKCLWIYDVMYSETLNAQFVQEKIFPFMSLKMRRKMLTFMSMHIKDSDRIVNFIKCCMDIQSPKLALKFVVNAANAIKLEFLRENSDIIEETQSKTFVQHFIGNSFTLAETLLTLIGSEANKIKVLYNIRHMYSLKDVGYLDMVERHVKFIPFTNLLRLGSTITKHLIKNHKLRIIENPRIYINLLHMKTVARYITADDAKMIVSELHPATVEKYWNECFCLFYSSIINKIPYAERYQLLKSMFNLQYKCQSFENNPEFYNKQCYKFMTEEEKLDWIRDQIKSHPEMYDKPYSLYSILAFEGAFKEITNLVKRCDSSEIRCDMMIYVLPTVKKQLHIKRLLDYYQHSKEPEHAQEDFINRLLQEHRGYYFNKDCWTILNEIFKKLKVYEFCPGFDAFLQNFRVVAILYYIINENNLSEELKTFMSGNEYINELLQLSSKAHSADQQKVYQYLFNFYLGKISEFDTEERVSELLQKYVTEMLDLLSFYGKTKDDIPEVVMQVVQNDRSNLKTHKLIHVPFIEVTQKEIMKLLKVDPKLAVDKLPSIIKTHELSPTVRVSQLFKKLKVYFFNDISQQYVEYYKNWLLKKSLSKSCTEAATYAIFLLSDDAFKVHFMTTNVPIDDEKSKIDPKKLRIQHAICATVLHSRPHVPLKHLLMYIKGQYIRSCLHLITSYLVNLPLPRCIEFIDEILKARSLAQERGIRVAFACFSAENLRKIVLYIWKKNNIASLRLILYSALYNKIANERECAQGKLFDILIELTSDLDENDNDIFKVIVSGGLPEHLASEFLNAAWIAVNSLPVDRVNLYRRADVIEHMCRIFYSMRQDHVRPIIEDFIEDLFDTLQTKISEIDDAIFYLYNKKWELAGKYVTNVRNENDLNIKNECVRLITGECLAIFNTIDGNKYIGRDLFMRFIRFMQSESYTQPFVCYTYINVLFETIIEALNEAMPMEQIYFMVWEIHVDMAVRKAIINIEIHCSSLVNLSEKITTLRDALIYFGRNIGNVINHFVERNTFYRNLTTIVVNDAFPHIKRIVDLVPGVKLEDVLVATSLALIDFKTPEHYMFALLLIPENYLGCYIVDYNTVLNEIRLCTNMDVIALMFQKFVNSDFKPRHFLKL
ncbi:unnamed protein product [Arctia plantaginis]|uniref:Uncharacterized protein n=1 Tax=Arctia plantaginis TaxID=874455 RepID=A0A8S0Z6F3_ARCPL|nr:unnamed protein product [Arctia plantaginis]